MRSAPARPRCAPRRCCWSISIHKDYLKFSAAHFLIFPDGSAERLHGHNYRVRVEVEAGLSPAGLVLDFKMVKPIVRAICDRLDEHWIVPGRHGELVVEPATLINLGFEWEIRGDAMVMTDLDPKLTFDSFVIGPANRLASAARSSNSSRDRFRPWRKIIAGIVLSPGAHHPRRGIPSAEVNSASVMPLQGLASAV
ncbi:MAG: hypothetical protein HC942_23950 [Microcoleus sp. SU_5_6]|nr:hypothetical protein [Microcoleus sp. SU_5_6]